jgi:eukaryotic-like serine/threonine-protein kinase
MPLPPATRLGPYELLAMIGAGGMGEVYRARDTRLGREVAVKVLAEAALLESDRLRRFEQEARAAGMLNHPNILAIYDVGAQDGVPYLVSELLHGETLRQRQKGAALSSRKAIDYALQITRGLAAAHQRGLVHRDLKPENLFLTNDGHLKILDFGLAKLTEPANPSEKSSAPTVAAVTDPGVVMGTVGYMSPEQVRGQPTDHRTDIFTFGAILYEMLTGRRAFTGDSTADVMSAILKEEPPDIPEAKISPGLDRVLRHCLEKRPEDRFESARDLAFALEALSGTSGIAAEQPVPRAAAKKRWLWPLVGALNVAALAAVAFFAWRPVQSLPPSRITRLSFRRGVITGARFAPDPQTILYSGRFDAEKHAVYSTHPPSPESRSFDFPNADLRAVSPGGDMLLLLDPVPVDPSGPLNAGTLAQAPLAGGSPRPLIRDVIWADWQPKVPPGSSAMALVRLAGPRCHLEFPPGKVLYDSPGLIISPRFSPQGDRLAFFEVPPAGRPSTFLQVIDLAGKRQTVLSGPFVFSLTWAPDGKEIWFTGVWNSPPAVYAVNLAGKARVLLRGYSGIEDIAPDGRVLVTGTDDRSSMLVKTPGDHMERELGWLNWSTPRALSDDGKFLLFDESHEGGGATGAVYLRKTDGSPPVRLSDGFCTDLSPDGQWAAAITYKGELLLLPVGAGEARHLQAGGLDISEARFFADGRRLLILAAEKNRTARLFIRDLTDNGTAKPISPEGSAAFAISPDGRRVAGRAPDGAIVFFPTDGGAPQPVPHLAPAETPLRWAKDANSLFISHTEGATVRIIRLDLSTGRRELMHEIHPADVAGSQGPQNIRLSADGRTYVYQVGRFLSSLYLVEGLR